MHIDQKRCGSKCICQIISEKKKIKTKNLQSFKLELLKKSNENPIIIILYNELCEITGYFTNMLVLVSFVPFSSLSLGK